MLDYNSLKDEPISIAKVRSCLHWTEAVEEEKGVPTNRLVEILMQSYQVHSNRAVEAINLAIKCNYISKKDGILY